MKLINSLAVGFGAALGSICRYQINLHIGSLSSFPISTLIVNIVGSLILGFLTGILLINRKGKWMKLCLGTGFCGGFTTMSTFAADVFHLSTHSFLALISYFSISIVGGLVCAWLGYVVGVKVGDIYLKLESSEG
ncbi:fluoride efflux transporter FluC [Bacillus sp. PS06]|uniref:fluoride efflux transporter FluC n=1 Tax=Bacillus sp. PS06 TaxID=2764176 RepID=UPI001783307C|nr:CrcB family protein [Bacillus sp. PS06]MBD8069237.1 CrcB family protein [Bacillus sp. PS06]